MAERASNTRTADELLAFLDLERIDGDLFRGVPGVWPADRQHIYGGQVAAQALRAAFETVPEGRQPHSLHGYFLRPGDPRVPVVFRVDRDRDGRSFSARRVAAMQFGEVIWDMACSFCEPAEGAEYAPSPHPDMTPPERAPLIEHDWCPLVEIRTAPRPDGGPSRPESIDRVWTRVVVPVPDDPILHACLLTYTSDIAAGFGDLLIDAIPTFGPSIDHALWFQRPARTDDWVLFDCEPMKVGGQRGLYRGAAYDTAGNLLAMLTQEMLLRPPRG